MNSCYVVVCNYYASVGGTRRRHTVVVCVCVCVFHSTRYSPPSLKIKDWNVQCKLSAMLSLVNFGLETLLSSYGVICSPWQLLPAVQSPAKNKSFTTGCLSTWQFNLYNKSYGDQSEIQRTRLPKLHSLSCLPQHITDHVQLKAWPNFGTHPCYLVLWLQNIFWCCSLCTQTAAWLHCS